MTRECRQLSASGRIAFLLPFALLAAWRTDVYAGQVVAHRSRGWRAVGEAAVCGAAVELAMATPGIVAHPAALPVLLGFLLLAAALGVASTPVPSTIAEK